MPIYEYQCDACGAKTEQLMRLSDPDPVECPSCHEAALRRMLSAPSFRLSGSGWYETDFKGGKDNKRNLAGEGGAEAKAESKPEAKADTTTESKPAAKPESKVESKPSSPTPAPAKPGTSPA